MSSFFKDLMDYNLSDGCCKCERIRLKIFNLLNEKHKGWIQTKMNILLKKKQFYQNRNPILSNQKKHNFESTEQRKERDAENQEKIVKHIIEYTKKIENDSKFKIFQNSRSRTRNAFTSQNIKATNETFDSIGCSHEIYKQMGTLATLWWYAFKIYGSVRSVDHCITISLFSFLEKNGMR